MLEVTTIEDYLYLYTKATLLSDLVINEWFYRKKGIYFLYIKDVVVYVGMSNYSIHSRIWEHKKNKRFESVKFIELNQKEDFRVAEYVYINIFNPFYNVIDKNFEYDDVLDARYNLAKIEISNLLNN